MELSRDLAWQTKSLFGNQTSFDAVALLEAEQTAGQLHEGDIGAFQFLPAHQQSP